MAGRRVIIDAPATGASTGAGRRDAGSTFLEVLIAIVLLGTVVVGILAAMRAGVIASSTSREAAKVETALLNASDRVSRAPLKCVDGGYVPYVEAAIAGWEGAGSATVTVKHLQYDQEKGVFEESHWVAGACPASGSQVQKVEITITGPDREVTRTIEVVKSKVGGKNV